MESREEKEGVVEREKRGQRGFLRIKEVITFVPFLIAPNFDKDFIIYSHASKHVVAATFL